MSIPPEMQDLIESAVKDQLLKLQRSFDMQLSQMEYRDPATIAQRQGVPMPPELIYVWTECLHMMFHPYIPKEAKQRLFHWIRSKVYPRLGLYIKNMVPIEDMLRPYLEEWDLEVAAIKISPEERAELLKMKQEQDAKKEKDNGDDLSKLPSGAEFSKTLKKHTDIRKGTAKEEEMYEEINES